MNTCEDSYTTAAAKKNLDELIDELEGIYAADFLLRQLPPTTRKGEDLLLRIRYRLGWRIGMVLAECYERDLIPEEIRKRLKGQNFDSVPFRDGILAGAYSEFITRTTE